MIEFQELEESLRAEADNVAASGESWSAERASDRLREIADLLTRIRNQHQGGIDASMGKRSGNPPLEI